MTGDVAFLLAFMTARLDEAEERARTAWPATWTTDRNNVVSTATGLRGGYEDLQMGVAHLAMTVGSFQAETRNAAHIAAWDPDRVLRFCAAVRRIIDRYTSAWNGTNLFDGDEYDTFLLPVLASMWADHPDYRPEWAAE